MNYKENIATIQKWCADKAHMKPEYDKSQNVYDYIHPDDNSVYMFFHLNPVGVYIASFSAGDINCTFKLRKSGVDKFLEECSVALARHLLGKS